MNTYYSDKPIIASTEDLLERKPFSQLLANTLINLKNTDTFTIGLFGKWGSGKTSIVNMALQEIIDSKTAESDDIVIVRFEPWHFSDSTQLLSQFFVRLSNEFKDKKDDRLKNIGKALEKYSSAFDLAKYIPKYGQIIGAFGKKGLSFLGKALQNSSEDLDILSQKQKVVELLNKQNCKILVVIDDIDRLSSEQIRQVFQLVSSVAKFPNTAYLLVFDKDVVIKALGKVQEGKGEDYLEKVIQMPIQIPEIPKEKLHNVLFDRLNAVLNNYPQTSFYKEHWQKIFSSCVSPFITNLRDINRLCNTLNFKLTTISTEIDFADMVAISSIEIGAPPIYEWIKEQKGLLTSGYVSQDIGAHKKTQNEWHSIFLDKIKDLIKETVNEPDLETIAKIYIEALSNLFPYFGQRIGNVFATIDSDMFRRKNLITHSEKFDRYFYYDLDQVFLKRDAIEQAVYSSNCEEFLSFLINEDNENRGTSAIQEVGAMVSELSSDRAKILFEALILSADKLKSHEKKNFLAIGTSTYAELLCIDLMEKISEEDRLKFLSSIINKATSETLEGIAVFINIIELAYGRLAANGTEHGYKKVFTLEQLLSIEKVFSEKVKITLSTSNLFEISDWRMILHLLQAFDQEFADEYLINAFKDNKNILSFLWDSTPAWIGVSVSYEIRDSYSKYLSKEQILKAINECVDSKEIFSLPNETIRRSAAFYLHSIGKVSWDGNISQEDADKLIDDWKTK